MMQPSSVRGTLAWLMSCLFLAVQSYGGEVVLYQGRDSYGGAADTWLNGSSGHQDENNGGDTSVHVRYNANGADRTALLRFDLSNQLPSNATVGSASVELYLYDKWVMNNLDHITVDLYRALVGWTEGTGTGQGGSERSGAAWLYRYAYPDDTGWNASGARGAGSDRASSADASVTIRDSTSNGWITFRSEGLKNTVATWHDVPSSNHGWVMDYSNSNDSNGVLFYSKEAGPSVTPRLVITYTGDIHWTGRTDGNWDLDTENWRATPNTSVRAKFTQGDTAIFDDTATSRSITIRSGGVIGGGIRVDTADTYTFLGGAIGGPGASLVKTGSGTLVLGNAANTYTGGTFVNGGTLRLGADGVLPDHAVSISGATLDRNGFLDTIGSLELSGGTVTGSGTLTLGGNLTSSGVSRVFGGSLDLPADRFLTISSGILTIEDTITGSGGIYKTGPGSLVLTNPNNAYSGSTYVLLGTLRLGANEVLPNNNPLSVSGTLDLQGFNETVGELTLSDGSVVGSGTLGLAGGLTSSGNSSIAAGTLALGGNRTFAVPSGTLTVSSAITGPGFTLTKTGDGILVLANSNNNYSGGTSVNAGTLKLGADGALPDYALGILGAALDLNGHSDTIGSLTLSDGCIVGEGTLTLGGDVNSGGTSSISDATLELGGDRTFDVASGGTLTVSSPITGAGHSLTKTGAGSLALTGPKPNTYTGRTTVAEGTLILSKDSEATAVPGDLEIQTSATVQLSNDELIANSATVTVDGTLYLYSSALPMGWTETIGGLAGSGKVLMYPDPQGGASLIIEVADGRSFVYNGELEGSGTLFKRGSGAQVLGGASSFIGPTQVEQGKLVIASTGRLGRTTEVVVAQNAWLTVNGDVNPAGWVNVYGTLAGDGQVGHVILQLDGTISPGTSPGTLYAQSVTWYPGGNYNWQIYDAGGQPGVEYDTLSIKQTLNLEYLSPDNPFHINLWTLSEINPDQNGPCINFDPTQGYEWILATAGGGILGFDENHFRIWVDPHNGTGGFLNDLAGGTFTLLARDDSLILRFTPVPEPSTLVLISQGVLILGAGWVRRRFIRRKTP